MHAMAVKAAPTPLLSNAVLRTDSENKPCCRNSLKPMTSPNYNMMPAW